MNEIANAAMAGRAAAPRSTMGFDLRDGLHPHHIDAVHHLRFTYLQAMTDDAVGTDLSNRNGHGDSNCH